jgi:hypothetical protein
MLLYVLYIRIVDCVKPLYSSGNQVIKRIESAYILLGIPEPEFVNVKEPQESIPRNRSARLYRMEESILLNRFLGSLNVYKFELWPVIRFLRNPGRTVQQYLGNPEQFNNS